jgi:hypothetical protein
VRATVAGAAEQSAAKIAAGETLTRLAAFRFAKLDYFYDPPF